jgi:hypothetical protein
MKITNLFQKYAFNLDEKKKAIEIEKTLHQAFKKKVRGFYYDIEKDDIQLNSMKKKLNRVKSSSIKECVYTNKKIPDQWRNKIGYHNNMFKIFSDDKNFLTYMGKGGNIQRPFSNEDSRNNMIMSKTVTSFYPKIDNKNLNLNLDNKNKNDNDKNINSDDEKNKINFETVKNYFLPGKKKEETEKEILTILEDYKEAFPIKREKKLLITEIHLNNENDEKKEKEEKDEKEKKEETDNKNIKDYANKTYTNSFYKKDKNLENNPFYNLDKMKLELRQEAYRQNIYTNLVPFTSRTQSSKIKKNKKRKIKKIEESKYGPFLNSNNEIFDKKVEINNPILKKYLESIHYFGPYYSFCPPHKSRNLEFYKNLDIKKANEIIQYIKKAKGYSIVSENPKENINIQHNIQQNIQTENLNNNKKNKEFRRSVITEVEDDDLNSNSED